jgi:hypothetical protein
MRLFLKLRKSRKIGKGDTPVYLLSCKKQLYFSNFKVTPTAPKCPIPKLVKLTEKEKRLAEKVINLIKMKIPVNKESPTGKKVNEFKIGFS